jgi:glycosyltransferase involved in cell wall biosynthesis
MEIEKHNTPLVSILIPCYNAERWVGHAIESALAQTWPAKEVIVVDDGSTDNSLTVIRQFAGRVRLEAGPHCGANPARNQLLTLARGEWLQYLDADDYLLPEKIAKQMQMIKSAPQADVVLGSVGLEYCSPAETRQELREAPEPHDPWVLAIRGRFVETSGALWRRKTLEAAGGWKPDQPCCQEQELYLRMLAAGANFIYCAHVGAIYRQWGEQTLYNRNKREVYRRALENFDRAEVALRERNQLTPERLGAISQKRFEAARFTWQYNTALAEDVMRKVQCSHPGFVPGGEAARGHYRIAYRLFGFKWAERFATLKRSLFASGGLLNTAGVS